MDVFILPKTLVSLYRKDIVDPKTKNIALTPKMLEILRGLYDEIFALYPQLDGIMIRVGENYLPKDVCCCATLCLPGGLSRAAWRAILLTPVAASSPISTLQAPYFDGNPAVDFEAPFVEQQSQYATLINCVRDKVADELGKLFVMRRFCMARAMWEEGVPCLSPVCVPCVIKPLSHPSPGTWDTSGFSPERPPRFHPSLAYYLNVCRLRRARHPFASVLAGSFASVTPSCQVTNQVEPHPNLVFSIKHTALDFWRYVKFNPCLAQGKHRQVWPVGLSTRPASTGALSRALSRLQPTTFDGAIVPLPPERARLWRLNVPESTKARAPCPPTLATASLRDFPR